MKQALSDRASLVRALRRRISRHQPVASTLRSGLPMLEGGGGSGNEVFVVARLDATLALRPTDIGPAADDARAAAAFRSFWGDRSELRRFQDGKISEAVVWDCAAAERHRIPDRVVEHALRVHLPPGSSVASCSGALDSALLQRPPGSGPSLAAPGGGSSGKTGGGAKRQRDRSDGSSEDMMDANAGVTAFRMMEAALGEGVHTSVIWVMVMEAQQETSDDSPPILLSYCTHEITFLANNLPGDDNFSCPDHKLRVQLRLLPEGYMRLMNSSLTRAHTK